MATILIENLTKIYPPTPMYPQQVQALGGISLSVTGNVFVAVLGPSGSGKTTLLNIVAGTDTPTAGTVQVVQDGVPAQIGYVFQEARLLPWRSVLQNMLYVQNRKSDRSKREAEFYLSMVGLSEVAHLYPAQLSAGMQQRVGIARAFLVNPDILLMDEPFSHMDALTGRSLRDYLQRIWLHTRKTALFVTHDVGEAIELADRILMLRPGGSVFDDIPVDLPRPRRSHDPEVRAMEAEVLRRFDAMEAAVRFGDQQH
ncbi:ABC transporter ATP-binding protein [Candidatus Poriferisodalis sp.]|uniref:ABC transporter ATP-binding protein n=1 Tax=Candidatus Poriferisodalis sp. TaxID=3101277 RepID=UPI003B023182